VLFCVVGKILMNPKPWEAGAIDEWRHIMVVVLTKLSVVP
jgi:hypothetical protein